MSLSYRSPETSCLSQNPHVPSIPEFLPFREERKRKRGRNDGKERERTQKFEVEKVVHEVVTETLSHSWKRNREERYEGCNK